MGKVLELHPKICTILLRMKEIGAKEDNFLKTITK